MNGLIKIIHAGDTLMNKTQSGIKKQEKKQVTYSMKHLSAQNLSDIVSILESFNATTWLEGGTLLGAYRDGDFCKDDHDDVDIGVWANYQYLIPKIVKKAKKQGFELYRHYQDNKLPDLAQQLAFKRHKMKVDVIFYEKKNDKAWGCVYEKAGEGFACIPRVAPAHFYETLDTVDFYGREYNIPFPTEDYLEYMYGDWKTPLHRSKYSCYNEKQLKALQRNFKRV